jgi:hypothetical protein
MNVVTIPVGDGRVVIGPPSRIPLAGSSRHHPVAAIGRIFQRSDAVDRLRASWERLGLAGDPRQMTPPAMRQSIEQAGNARRLVAIFLPPTENIVIDLDWYEIKDKPRSPTPGQHSFVQLSEREKIERALTLTLPKLKAQGHKQLADALEALLGPKTIATMIGLMLALMAAHAYGIGEIADIALIAYAYSVAGTDGVLAIGRIADATIDAARAKSAAELDKIAERYAEAFVALGAAFLSGLLTRMTQRAATMARPREPAAPRPAPSPVEKLPPKPFKPASVPLPKIKPLLDAESVIARQAGATLEDLHQRALANQKLLGALGERLEQELGAAFKNPGVKALERAAEKLANEGYADASELKDLSRAAFAVKDRQQAEAIVNALRKEYPVYDKGWQELKSGYLDRKIIVQFPNGGVSEIQLVPETIWDYKVGEGHRLYEIARSTDESAVIDQATAAMAKQYETLLKNTPFGKGPP